MLDSSTHNELQGLINEGLQVLYKDDTYQLKPYFRNHIYQFLYSKNEIGVRSVLWVQVITAQYVLPITNSVTYSEFESEHLIDLAKGILCGTVTKENAKLESYKAWDILENSVLEGRKKDYVDAFYSFNAAVQALDWVIEIPKYREFNDDETDENWLDTSADVALFAAAGFAGINWDRGYDSTKGKEFWEWWLTKAIPLALTKSGI